MWTKDNYPDTFKNLEEQVRNKAIEIANSLLEQNYDKGRAIATAINQEKKWAENDTDLTEDFEKIYHISYRENDEKWEIKAEENENASSLFDIKQDAIEEARKMADNQNAKVIIHKKDGTEQQEIIPD